MSTPGPSRRFYKRRGTHDRKRMVINIDLNSPPPVADVSDVASSSRTFQNVPTYGSLINLDDDGDDNVRIVPASRPVPEAPIVILDEEEDINPESSGNTREVIDLELSLDMKLLGFNRIFTNPNPNPDRVVVHAPPPKEPTFNCPVCMNPLVEPSSTICGHIFCKECITMSIKAQKKCPTCRRKLSISNFHRVYLPNAE